MLSLSTSGAILLLVALAAWAWLLRRARAGTSRGLSVLERQSLGGGAFVATVRAGDRRFLIGGGSGRVRMLAELERADEPVQLGEPVRVSSSQSESFAARSGGT